MNRVKILETFKDQKYFSISVFSNNNIGLQKLYYIAGIFEIGTH